MSPAKTNQHLCLFQIHAPLSLIPGKGELHIFFLDCINVTLGYPKSMFTDCFGIMDFSICLVIIYLFSKILCAKIPVKWKWQNRHFWQFFLITNFCVKIVANTNKKIWWGHIDWKLKLKKNELFLVIWWFPVAL